MKGKRIKKVILLTLGYTLGIIMMNCLNLVTFSIGPVIFFYFLGAFSYAISDEKSTKKEDSENESKDNTKQRDKKEDGHSGFHRSDMRPSINCCNSDSYGCVCVRCGRCGRKF